jgi:hypothetical protein
MNRRVEDRIPAARLSFFFSNESSSGGQFSLSPLASLESFQNQFGESSVNMRQLKIVVVVLAESAACPSERPLTGSAIEKTTTSSVKSGAGRLSCRNVRDGVVGGHT